jgi:hypothetical protein
LLFIHTNGTSKKKAREMIEQRMRKAFSGPYGTVRNEVYQMYLMEHGSPAYQVPPRPVIEPAVNSVKDEVSKHLLAALSAFSCLKAHRITVAPFSRNFLAVAKPMPLLPPVMIAT